MKRRQFIKSMAGLVAATQIPNALAKTEPKNHFDDCYSDVASTSAPEFNNIGDRGTTSEMWINSEDGGLFKHQKKHWVRVDEGVFKPKKYGKSPVSDVIAIESKFTQELKDDFINNLLASAGKNK